MSGLVYLPNGAINLRKPRIDRERLANYKCLLLLDIDNVMNSDTHPGWRVTRYGIDDWHIERLNRIIEQCNPGIVLSSAWRDDKEDRRYLRSVATGIHGWADRYVGDTPKLDGIGSGRGKEILTWLKTAKWKQPFAVVDDIATDMAPVWDHFFQTTDTHGLTDEIADAISAHLVGK